MTFYCLYFGDFGITTPDNDEIVMMKQLPGTNEEGLQWMKNKANQAKGSLVTVWFGPFNPAISLYHPNSVKAILKTSGLIRQTFI
jgi:hypothetical protein